MVSDTLLNKKYKMEKFKKKAKELLTTTRFDLIVKYLYAKSYKNGYETDYFLKMYKQHLKIWNNFKEYNNPKKNSFEAFKEIFEELIDEITVNGFNGDISAVPVMGNNILNGAHRVAASLVNNNDVVCVNGIDGRDGQLNCGWSMFENLGLRPEYADRVALEYAKLKPNTHIVTVFPSATSRGGLEQVEKILNDNTKVFYKKRVKLNNVGAFNIMREFYYGEAWAGKHPEYGGFRAKAKLCYQGEGDTVVYLCEFNSLQDTVRVKDKIRRVYNIGKHSVHINDRHEETVRIAKALFNDNSVHFLNNNKSVGLTPEWRTKDQQYYTNFESLLNQYINYFKQHGLDSENYCVTASSVLSIYGLREGQDLDYIHHGDVKINGNNLISSHNSYGVNLYPFNYDEIIFNPNHHFYTRGVKFMVPRLVRELKETRGEEKDKRDVKLINTII
jgi:hypothetical protein